MHGGADKSERRALALSGKGGDTVGTLIELEFLDSSFSSNNLSIRAFRAYPLIEIRQLPVERFEATASQSTVPSPLMQASETERWLLTGEHIVRDVIYSSSLCWRYWRKRFSTNTYRNIVCFA